MKIKCLHGYFIFEETAVGQISDFCSLTGLELSPKNNYYTFTDLLDAPNYSIEGAALMDTVSRETFEGEPWDVFEANSVVYNFQTGLVELIETITNIVKIELAGNRYITPGLILPGSRTSDGEQVKNYSAYFSRQTLRWLYSEVEYV